MRKRAIGAVDLELSVLGLGGGACRCRHQRHHIAGLLCRDLLGLNEITRASAAPRLGCRAHDDNPNWSEIGLHLVTWSVVAEAVVPRLIAHTTADWRDVVAYSAGAVVAGIFWQGLPLA